MDNSVKYIVTGGIIIIGIIIILQLVKNQQPSNSTTNIDSHNVSKNTKIDLLNGIETALNGLGK